MTITKVLLPTVLKQKAVHLVNKLLHLKILTKATLCSLKHASPCQNLHCTPKKELF